MSDTIRTNQPPHLVVADPARLAALRRTALLDSPTEESFDRLTRLASRVLAAPVALVSLVDEDRQFFKSQCGLPEPWASRRETPLSHSFCQHVVAAREPLVIEDARAHPLVRDNFAIRDLEVIAYLGVPLITHDGYELGSLCVIDRRPRAWTADEVRLLRDLASSVLTEVELRYTAHSLKEEVTAMRAREALSRLAAPVSTPRRRPRPREDARAAHIQALAREAEQRLAAGTASLVDVAFHPRDVLWLADEVLRHGRTGRGGAGSASGQETSPGA